MAKTINLDIPASVAERVDISVLKQLLANHRNGDLNNEQMVRALQDWANARQTNRVSGHSHFFDEDVSCGVVGGEGGVTKRCQCGARLWEPSALTGKTRGDETP